MAVVKGTRRFRDRDLEEARILRDAFADQVRARLRRLGMRKGDLAVALGMTSTELSRMLRGPKSNLTLATMSRISSAIGCGVRLEVRGTGVDKTPGMG